MSKRKSYHANLDKILNIFLAEEDGENTEIAFEEKTLEDGTVIRYADMEIGTAVMVVDADGV